MRNSTRLSIRIDTELKKEAEDILMDLGTPNASTITAMTEVEAIIKDPKSKGYDSAEDMLRDVFE